jgi:RNA polymerase sigma-70 factor (ECF subfamily)
MTPMDDRELADHFDEHRTHLRAVAYRMLGSISEADDAVQDTWVRASRAGVDGVENLGGWLTTIVTRVCLNMLRSRTVRREEPLEVHVPDPIVSRDGGLQPEDEAILADSVGLALQVVIDSLAPAERIAFVLHDLFAFPFEEIAPMVERSPDATRQLASRARRRVQGAAVPSTDADVTQQRAVVNAFFAAARAGDVEGLVALLDPDVVLRADFGPKRPAVSRLVRGAEAVANQARLGANPNAELHPVLVNGSAGVVVVLRGLPFSLLAFSVVDGRIVEIDVIGDAERVGRVAAGVLDEPA